MKRHCAFLVQGFIVLATLSAWGGPELRFGKPDRQKTPQVVFDHLKDLMKRSNEAALTPGSVEMSTAWVDLNSDKREDLCASFASSKLFGNAGGSITCYLSNADGTFVQIISVESVAPDFAEIPGSRTKGFFDLRFGGPGTTPSKLWKWDGSKYK